MYESSEPLTDFFRRLTPAARAAGYKCIITLLAREADCEDIFQDVKRYWSSLDDVTGEHVLFVLGAKQVQKALSYSSGMPERRAPVLHLNPHAVMAGRRPVYWPGDSHPWHRAIRKGHLNPSNDLIRAHSMEIAALRNMFGLSERSIPALLMFALDADAERTGFLNLRPTVVLPLSELGGKTIYRYLKELVADLEDNFASIDRIHAVAVDLRRRLDKLPNYASWRFRYYVSLAELEATPEAKLAGEQILAICCNPDRQLTEKRTCYDLLRVIVRVVGSHAMLTSDLQRLIDHSFFAVSSEGLLQQERRIELASRLNAATEEEQVTWRELIARIQARHAAPRENEGKLGPWDYFITYSSKDYWYAERLFAELAKYARVFLDRVCLLPGDVWPVRLRAEQDRSRCTVVLLTGNTDQAWFAESECLHAIELARRGDHRIIPILVGKQAVLPYGLEQLHAIRHEDHGNFQSTVRQIRVAGKSVAE